MSSLVHRANGNGISEELTRFYAVGILDAIDYLHSKSIAHRDIKPSNFVINTDGFPILTSLAFAKKLPRGGKTFTSCGTYVYHAPEIVTQQGYHHSIDIWAFGVTLYEMIVGKTPFREPGMSTEDTYKCIVTLDYKVPPTDSVLSDAARDLIANLLVIDPQERLGCGASKRSAGVAHDDIRAHDFFSRISDWESYKQRDSRTVPVPWIPEPQLFIDLLNGAEGDLDWRGDDEDSNNVLSSDIQKIFRDF